MKYIELESAKFMKGVIKEERRETRRARNRRAVHNFFTFLIGLGALYACAFAVRYVDHWQPLLDRFLSAVSSS